jgi:Ser/Thr protein kinase RdoA (MazF antagonist)
MVPPVRLNDRDSWHNRQMDDQPADRIADTITGLTGRLWNDEERVRLAEWLKELRHRDVALRWLRYVEAGNVDPATEFALRTPLQDALTGTLRQWPIVGFVAGRKRRRWRRHPEQLVNLMSQMLDGGVANAGNVVREGDVVLRPAPTNVHTLHALLAYLAGHGFPAPQPLETRPDGREALSFIEGETSTPPYSHQWVRSDGGLAEVGRLLRSLHDASADFTPPPGVVWSKDLADARGGAVICHNDVCIENVIFSGGSAVGLVDFDFAAPGRPVWDLAMTARYWVPLLDPTSAAATGRQDLDPFSRCRLLVDAYGADTEARRAFTAVLLEVEEVALRFVLGQVKRRNEPFVQMWKALGGEDRQRRKMAWLEQHRARLDEALTT